MNQKNTIAILGVVVVVLLGTTVYFATINNVSQPVVPAPKVTQQSAPTSVTQQQITNQQQSQPSSALGISEKTIGEFSKKGYSNWKAYSVGTIQLDLPTFFDKNIMERPEILKIIKTTDPDIKESINYMGSIGCDDENYCIYGGGADGYINIVSYNNKTSLAALQNVCKEITSEKPGVSCAPKKFTLASGLEAYELGIPENYWSVNNGTETYVFSLGNSSGAVKGEKDNLWKTIMETVRPIKK